MISTALLLINLGLAKDDGIAGRWFATGITTATIEIATNPPIRLGGNNRSV